MNMTTTTGARSESETTSHGPSARSSARVRRSRVLKRVAWALGTAAVVGAIVLSMRPEPVMVQVVPVRRGDLVVTVDELAKTRVRDRFVVSAPTAGSLLRITLRPGDSIAGSGVLATIVPLQPAMLDPRSRAEAEARARAVSAAERQARATVARAGLAKEHADQDLAQVKSLVTAGSLAPERLRDAELEARLRNEEVASARFAEQMAAHDAVMAGAVLRRFDTARPEDRFDVTSPISGRVLRVIHESAGVVQPGTPLLELGDPAYLEVVSDLLTADAVRLKPGAKVTVSRWGGPPLAAHVKTVEPAAFTRISALGVEEQRVSVVIDLDEARDRWAALGDGYRVEVRIVVEEKKNVLSVPLGATFRHDSGWATYVLRNDKTMLTPVRLGARSDADVEVESGLGEGDRVVVHPSERVADQKRVALQ